MTTASGPMAAAPWHLAEGAAGPEAYGGRPLLLLFWNIGCAGCTGRALPLTVKLAGQYPDLGIVAIHSVFGEGRQQPGGSVRAVADHFNLPYPVLLDDGEATFRSYGAEGTPHWVLIGPDGTILRSIFGSMEGARQRLQYALREQFPDLPPTP